MKKIYILVVFLMTITFVQQAKAGDVHKELKNYFNNLAVKVKNEQNPEQKREILNNSFKKIQTALNEVEHNPLLSDNDLNSIASFKKQVKLNYDELNGLNGFERVKDNNLNNFADYSVQNLEQSAEYITISIVTLVLIIIAAALLL